MYTVRQIIELASYTATDWPPERMLMVIKEINREMLSGNTKAIEYRDPLTGLPYTFDTTDGLYYYQMPDICRKVKNVLARSSRMTDSYVSGFNYKEYAFLGETWYSLLNVQSYPRSQTVNASIVLPANPGTTTGIYYVEFWIEPTDIDSINSIVYIQPEFEGLMIEGVIARIQAYQYGKFDVYNEWKERMKIEYWGALNNNPPMNNFSATRPC